MIRETTDYLVIKGDIKPKFIGGYVFGKRQILVNLSEREQAKRRAYAHNEQFNEDVAVYAVTYNKDIGCVVDFRLIMFKSANAGHVDTLTA